MSPDELQNIAWIYRERAKQLRDMAAHADLETSREQLTQLAEEYDSIAAQVESRTPDRDHKRTE
ncbi:MAG: hypothetical protein ACM30I_13470 [Gemmatimonas sp.]